MLGQPVQVQTCNCVGDLGYDDSRMTALVYSHAITPTNAAAIVIEEILRTD